MKIKHLLTLALMVIGGSAWAQNLLQNSDFGVKGDLISGAKYKIGTPWVWSIGSANVRVESSSLATEGGNVLIWRGSANNNYISQEVAAEAGAAYEITLKQVASGNANANFNVGIGTEVGKYDIASTLVRLGTTIEGEKTVRLLIPENVESDKYYFTFANTTTNSSSSGSDPVTQIDFIKMIKVKPLQELMEESTDENPTDVTIYYIQNPTVTGTTGWTNGRTASGQQYTNAIDNTYLDTWNSSLDQKQVVNLKPGKYTLKAATRAISGIGTANIYANIENGSNNSTNITAVGNSGGELGNGWGWTTVDFIVWEESDVTIGFYSDCGNSKWAGADNFSLSYRKITDADRLAKAKNELESAINKIIVPTANIEDNTENVVAWGKQSVDDVKVALEDAKLVLASSNDIDVIKTCTDEVNNLGCEIVLPVCNEFNPYNIIMAKEGLGWTGNAVTFTYSEGNENNYAMAYSEKPGESNFNQAVYFDLNADNDLYMYIIDAEGKKWYVTDGTRVGSTVAWAGSQIRMTDVEEDAMPIDIEPSLSKEGVCELFNIWTGEHIGSTGNNGFYCSNDNYELAIKPAAKKEIEIKVAKYGTVILPADDSNGLLSVKFYSVNSLENNELVLTEEDGDLKANTPYIVENLNTIEDAFVQLEKYANAFKSSYTNGLLTGVFADTEAPTGSYVLQKQNDKIAFYAVSAEDPITVPAGKAYLTDPANTEAKAISFPSATAIKAIDALTSGSAKIYDVNGREINKLQKGINIVNGVKVLVK